MTLQEYYDLLEKHDWLYEYSDDFNVWSKGNEERKKIEKLSTTTPKHEELYLDFIAWVYNSWANPRPAKPKIP